MIAINGILKNERSPMNKKTLIILAFVVVAIVIVLFVTDFPPGDDSKASGTIGKVEKYREVNIGGNDLQLRTDFVNDKGKLTTAVSNLMYYYAMTVKLENILQNLHYDKICEPLKSADPNLCEKLKKLEKFIENNNGKLKNTINALVATYQSGKSPSGDLENKIISVADFYFNLLERNNVLNDAVAALDMALSKNPKIADKKAFVELRDFLYYINLDMALMTGDEENAKFLGDKKFLEPDKYLAMKNDSVYFLRKLETPKLLAGLDDVFVNPNKFSLKSLADTSEYMSNFAKLFPGLSILQSDAVNVVMITDDLNMQPPPPEVPMGGEHALSDENLKSVMSDGELNIFLCGNGVGIYQSDGNIIFVQTIYADDPGQATQNVFKVSSDINSVYMIPGVCQSFLGYYSYSGIIIQSDGSTQDWKPANSNLDNVNFFVSGLTEAVLFSVDKLGFFAN